MNIYEVWFHDEDAGNCMQWAGTKADAAKLKKELRNDGYSESAIEIKAIDFPTDKAGLLGWLNSRVTRDNG